MTEVGAVSFGVRLDLSSIDTQIKQLQTRLASKELTVKAKVEDGFAKDFDAALRRQSAEAARLGQELNKTAAAAEKFRAAAEKATLTKQQKEAAALDREFQKTAAAAERFRVSAEKATLSRQQKEAAALAREIERTQVASQRAAEAAARLSYSRQQKEIAGFAREFEKAAAAQAKLQQQQSRDRTTLQGGGLDPRAAQQVEAAVKRVGEQNQRAAVTAATLRQQYGLSETEVRKVEQALASATREQDGLTKGANNFATAIAGAAVAAAVGGAFKTGADAFIAFEAQAKSFEVLAGASGGTAEGIKSVQDEARRLGSTTAFTAAQVQGLAVELSRAGLSTDDIEKSLAGISLGAIATGTDLTRLGEVAARALVQFQEDGSQAQKFVDILGVAASNSATDVNGLGEALSFVGGSAKASNQSIETTSLLLGLLANAGITGSRAGTNLQAVFDELKKASADLAAGLDTDAAQAFKLLNVDIRNTDGTLKDLSEVLPELRENFSNLTAGQKETIENGIFGQRGGRAFTAIVSSSTESVDKLNAAIQESGGFSKEAGKAVSQGLPGALVQFSSAIEGASSALFATFAPAAELVVRTSTALLQAFQSLPGPVRGVIASLAAAVGVTGALASITAIYNTALVKAIIAQVQQGAATAANTAATAVNTAAKLASLAVNGNLGAAFTRSAVGIKAQSAALITNSAAAKTATAAFATAGGGLAGLKAAFTAVGTAAAAGASAAITALAPVAITAGAIGGAVASVVAVFDTFNTVQGPLRDAKTGVADIETALEDLAAATPETAEAIAGIGFESEISLNRLQRALEGVRRFLPGIATAAEATANNAAIAFSELSLKAGETEDAAIKLAGKIGQGIEVDEAQVTATVNAIDTTIKALESQAVATEQDAALRDAQVARLNRYRDAIQNVGETVEETGDAIEALGSRVQRTSDSLSNSINQITLAAAQAQAEILESQASGVIDTSDATDRLAANESAAIEKRLTANRNALAELKALQSEGGDPEAVAKAGAEIVQIEQTIAQDRIALAQTRIKAEEDVTKAVEENAKKQLAAFERSARRAQTEVDKSRTSQVTDVLIQEDQGVISAEESARRIREINIQAAADNAAAKAREIDKVKELESSKVLTAEEAADRILDLSFEVEKATQEQIKLQIEGQKAIAAEATKAAEDAKKAEEERRKAAVDRINEELRGIQQIQQARAIELDIVQNALTQEQNLINAGASLAATRNQLDQTRLQTSLAIANAEGDIAGAQRLTGQIAEAQLKAVEDEFAAKRAGQKVSEQLARIEAQRAIQASEIASIEADIAVRRAQADGSTAAEVRGLQQIAALRREQVGAARDNAAITDQVLAKQREELGLQEQISAEQLRQNNIAEASNRLADARRGIISALAAESNTTTEESLASIKQIEDRLKTAQRAGLFQGEDVRGATRDVRNAVRAGRNGNDRRLIELAQQDNPLINQLLQAAGRSDITGLVEADRELNLAKAFEDGNAAIVDRLDQLIEQGLGARIEQLVVQTPDPIGDTSRIVSDVANMQTAGVNA